MGQNPRDAHDGANQVKKHVATSHLVSPGTGGLPHRRRPKFQSKRIARTALGKSLQHRLGASLLVRQNGPAQRSLTRSQRLISAQFARRSSAKPLAGANVAVVDDVLTTRATVRRVSRRLRQLGGGLIDV